jgi:hypothetical protein
MYKLLGMVLAALVSTGSAVADNDRRVAQDEVALLYCDSPQQIQRFIELSRSDVNPAITVETLNEEEKKIACGFMRALHVNPVYVACMHLPGERDKFIQVVQVEVFGFHDPRDQAWKLMADPQRQYKGVRTDAGSSDGPCTAT